jgi:Tfp pilus assembly protein PilF
MSMHFRAGLAALLAIAALPVIAESQRDRGAGPARPRLASTADTNDSRAYYDAGVAALERDPARAAAAFYWAVRLNPTHAEAYFAQRVALHLTNRARLQRYWRGDRRTIQSAEVRAIDSLYLKALEINPYVSTRLERQLQRAIILAIANAPGTDASPGEIEFFIERYLSQLGPAERAWRAYTEGRNEDALSSWARAIKDARRKAWLRTQRGRLLYQIGRVDSALVELNLAVEELRSTDQKDLVHLYESKALLEHSIGLAHYRKADVPAAREAFARAIQEDASFAPAHLQLGYMALEQADTAAALAEIGLAVQLRENDVALRYLYGDLLERVRRLDEAEEHLGRAVELNPDYALPYFALGRVHEARGAREKALENFVQFRARAALSDGRASDVNQRINRLRSSGGAGAGAP